MIHIRDDRPNNLVDYVPDGYSNDPCMCLQTHYSPNEYNDMIRQIDHLANDVYSLIDKSHIFNNSASFLPIPQTGKTSFWINKYKRWQRTGLHRHTEKPFTDAASHFAIYVIDVGSQKEYLNFGSLSTKIEVFPGDLFVARAEELHGAPPVNEKLVAMVFGVDEKRVNNEKK